MSDFLASLVHRSMTPAAAVRPRVASLFEPVGLSGFSADVAEPRDEHATRELPLRRNAPDAAIEPSAPRRTSLETTPRMQPGPVAQAVNARADILPIMADVRETASVAHPSVSTEYVHRVLIDEERGGSMSRERSRDSTHPDLVTPAQPSPSQRERGLPAVPDSRLEAPPKDTRADERGLLVPPAIGAGIAAELQAAVSALTAGPAERRASAREPFARGPAEASEASVHVTIGRVEVRATKEGSAPVRQRTASPVMSLDEYLRINARRGAQ